MSNIPSSQGKTTGATINIIPTIMAIMPIISRLVFEFMFILCNSNYIILFKQTKKRNAIVFNQDNRL